MLVVSVRRDQQFHEKCEGNPINNKFTYKDLRLNPHINPYNAELILYKSWRSKGFNQFEIIENVLVSSF